MGGCDGEVVGEDEVMNIELGLAADKQAEAAARGEVGGIGGL